MKKGVSPLAMMMCQKEISFLFGTLCRRRVQIRASLRNEKCSEPKRRERIIGSCRRGDFAGERLLGIEAKCGRWVKGVAIVWRWRWRRHAVDVPIWVSSVLLEVLAFGFPLSSGKLQGARDARSSEESIQAIIIVS